MRANNEYRNSINKIIEVFLEEKKENFDPCFKLREDNTKNSSKKIV